jgi:pyruvate dehydrogenase E2 component (dihydrolipoamide acetyltransferase)
VEGVLLEILFQEGEEVPVLSNVAVIGKPGDDVSAFLPVTGISGEQETKTETHAGSTVTEPAVPSQPIWQTEGKKRISPRARLVAKELGIDPGQLQGSGPGGRVMEQDVRNAAATRKKEKPAGPSAINPIQEPVFSGEDSGQRDQQCAENYSCCHADILEESHS